MRHLLACTCLTPLVLIPVQASAETVIDNARTASVATSTIKNGAADDIRIAAAGSVKPTGGTAVTLDSANSVKNEGTIQITGANDATGIHANAGIAGSISNSGKIILDESYTPADGDKDGDLDGPFAQGLRRAGIRAAGAFTGAIANSGSIQIEGNDSYGIHLAGPLTGSLTNSGSVEVTGNNGFGIRAGDVSGTVTITGDVGAQGQNSVAVAIDGNVGGALRIQSQVTATGYRALSPPADQSKLDADDLLQGGPALRVTGNVGGGILFDMRPKDSSPTDNDEDDDGIEDAKEGNAIVTSYGAAPAVVIGSATAATSIGAVAGHAPGHGIVVNGEILGSGLYKGVDGNGLVIGGLGGAVNVAGGVTIDGGVSAKSADANATALRIGTGASVPTIRVGGVVAATGGAAAANTVHAISIDAGANVQSLVNSGTIGASASGQGSAAAIVDRAGTVTLVENSGSITAQSGATGADKAVAIDLTANNSGATVRQTAVVAGAAAPRIAGSILFGSGNDLLDVADGSVTGTTRFGAGDNRLSLGGDATYAGDVSFGAGADTVTLAGTAAMSGKLDFLGGGGDSLTLGGTSRFSGSLANAAGVAVAVNGGRLDIVDTGTVAIGSLSVSGGGSIGIRIDPTTGAHTQYVVGSASFAEGSKLNVSLSRVGNAEGSYVVLRTGALTGAANLSTADASLPYMFKGNVTANQAAGELTLQIARKTTTELGLTRSQSEAYGAVFEAIDTDSKVAGSFLAIADGDAFRLAVQQMLPEHAGGAFETVTQGSRAVARYIADPDALVSEQDGWAFWLTQAVWGTSKDRGQTASFETFGWGGAGGVELDTGGAGRIGVSLAFLGGRSDDDELANEVTADQYEAAAYWRGRWGGFAAHARVAAAQIQFSGQRHFAGLVGTEQVERSAEGEWDGKLYSASGGLSYGFRTGRLTLRPSASIDYYRLDEDGYAEEGGGDAFDLVVASRESDELAVTGALALGYDLGSVRPGDNFLRVELEAGRRQIVCGSLGATVAHFDGGDDFTLFADERDSGWVGKARLVGGNEGFRAGGEVNVEQQQGRAAVAVRASLSIGI